MKKLFIVIPVLLMLFSCQENREMYDKIEGEWDCVTWINTTRGTDQCNNNVYFQFEEDKTYISQLGVGRDTGRYKIIGESLFVTPRDKREFSVKITRLTQDTMVFLMNNAGEEEILTLYKMNE